MAESRINNHAAFVWDVADLLRGDYKQSAYGKVILPFAVLCRFDCVLEPTKPAVLARATKLHGQIDNVEPVLGAAAGQRHRISVLQGGEASIHQHRQVLITAAVTGKLVPPGVAA